MTALALDEGRQRGSVECRRMDGDEGLRSLRGGHLDTVAFVMNYVEFRIGGNVLRALSPPSLALPTGQRVTFPQAGSRDALCEMIDTT